MDIIQAVFLGIVQGLTEFLPVSSSGHLALLQKFFGLKESPIFFDTLIHFATLLAVVFYLRKEIWFIVSGLNKKENQKLVGFVILATIPAVIVGFLLKDNIEQIFNSLRLLSVSFLITSIILFTTKFFSVQGGEKVLKNLGWLGALVIGLFQALSILPGVSRSGSTISAGLFLGLKREEAFKFSFLMAIPAIFGAMVLQIFEINKNPQSGLFLVNFAGFFTAVIFGFISLKILEKITQKGKLHYFAFYTLILAIIILFI